MHESSAQRLVNQALTGSGSTDRASHSQVSSNAGDHVVAIFGVLCGNAETPPYSISFLFSYRKGLQTLYGVRTVHVVAQLAP